jgi:hypothetical protein
MTSRPDRAWVATRKGLLQLRRAAGGSWTIAAQHFLGEPVSMLLPPGSDASSPDRMLAALNLGHFGVKLHRSDDAGAHWTEVATPTYPEQPAGAEGPPWTLVQVWAMVCANGSVWVGTLPGGLFRSRDFGDSWELVRGLWDRPGRLGWFGGGYDVPGIHSLCPHPARAQEMLVGISCGGAWTTRDDGETWALTATGMRANFMPPEQADNPNIQDPHLIVRCPAQPDVFWCQHHGGIWRSTDGAATWVEVTGVPVSNFGFAVAVHPEHADTAWFVPAQADQCRVPVDGALVVNRTRDGGASFDTLRHGLPQQHCYDLVYRHGLAVGADGRTLLMGSTSGGLWGSFDAGDTWHTVSLNLPPIYAVRI